MAHSRGVPPIGPGPHRGFGPMPPVRAPGPRLVGPPARAPQPQASPPHAVPGVDTTDFLGNHALGRVDTTLAQPTPAVFRPGGLGSGGVQQYNDGGPMQRLGESDPTGNVRVPGAQLN